MSMWQSLRDRRIIQIVVAYLGAGLVALEVCDQLVDRSILPEITYRLVLVLYLAGIPASLIVGWFHGERGDQRVSRLEFALLVLVGVAGLGVGVAVVERYRSQATAAPAALAGSSLDLRRVAVLYFEDASDGGALRYLADGLTEGLIERLSQVRALRVVSANGVRPFRGSALQRDSIARSLGAGILIDGAVEHTGSGLRGDASSQIRVTTRLLDGESGALLERTSVALPLGEVLAVKDTIAAAIARTLRTWLGEEILPRERRAETASAAAWTLFQRARGAIREAEAMLRASRVSEAFATFERADSLLARAEAVDSAWIRPIVERGWIAYRRSRAVHDPEQAGAAIHAGTEHAMRALAHDPNHAPALELRGTLRYWKYLLHLAADPAEQASLLNGARDDLERSVQLDPSLASAHAALSHLYYQAGDLTNVAIAAKRAYEEDAYLADAGQVLWRLFLANYDLGQFQQAEPWCDVGRRRFVDDVNFGLCRLYMLTTPYTEPDIDEAWTRMAGLDSIAPPDRPDPRRNLARMLLGAVIGRAGLADSADHVLRRARLGPNSELDPALELYAYEAFARTRFDDFDAAIDLLKRYVAVNHGFERGAGRHWWWQDLREHPRFGELETSAH